MLGNAGIDIGLALPHLPQIGETLPGQRMSRAAGGKGLNQAIVAARAGVAVGVPVHFCRRSVWIPGAGIGGDAGGGAVRGTDVAAPQSANQLFSGNGVSCRREQHRRRRPLRAALDADTGADFAAEAGPGDLLLLQGNLTQATIHAAIAAGVAQGAAVMLNPAPLWWLPGPMLVANRGEATALTGETDPHHAAGWLHRAGVTLAVVTLGADGCFTADRNGTRQWPAAPTVTVDTTGCGDAFCGVLAVQRVRSAALQATIAAAQRAAAVTAGKSGAYAALPSIEDLARCLHADGVGGPHTERKPS